MKIQEAGMLYLEYLLYKKRVRQVTYTGRTKEINRLIAFWFNREVEDILVEDVQAYEQQMKRKGNSDNYIIRMLLTVRALFNFLRTEKKLEVLASHEITMPKRPRKPVIYYTHEELENLLDFPKDNIYGARLMAWIMLILSTGMRISESLKIRRDQFIKDEVVVEEDKKNDIKKTITIYKANIEGKGGIARQIIVYQWAMVWIEAYLKMRKDDHPALFLNTCIDQPEQLGFWIEDNVRYFLRLADKRVGRRVTPHGLRRTASTHAYFNGADSKAIQDFLGHLSLQYTVRYLGVDYNRLAGVLYKNLRYDYVPSPAPTIEKVWAARLGYSSCKGCGTNDRPHSAQGFCHRCYVSQVSVDKRWL